jgi:hypothetical protein
MYPVGAGLSGILLLQILTADGDRGMQVFIINYP